MFYYALIFNSTVHFSLCLSTIVRISQLANIKLANIIWDKSSFSILVEIYHIQWIFLPKGNDEKGQVLWVNKCNSGLSNKTSTNYIYDVLVTWCLFAWQTNACVFCKMLSSTHLFYILCESDLLLSLLSEVTFSGKQTYDVVDQVVDKWKELSTKMCNPIVFWILLLLQNWHEGVFWTQKPNTEYFPQPSCMQCCPLKLARFSIEMFLCHSGGAEQLQTSQQGDRTPLTLFTANQKIRDMQFCF